MDTIADVRARAIAAAAWAGAAVVLVMLSHVLSFGWIAALGVVVTAVICVLFGAGRGAGDVLARAIIVALMFGPAAAGMVTLASALIALALAALPRTVTTLALVTPLAALVAAFGAPAANALLGGSDLVGPVVAVLALGAPGIVLSGMAAATVGPIRAADARLLALTPGLLALVVGARIGGLDGAAAAIAAATLATPLAMLLLPGPGARRRMALAQAGLGVLAAGFTALVAVAAALQLGGGRPLAAVPAAAIGLLVYYVALRVHSPAAAGRLPRRLTAGRAEAPPPAGRFAHDMFALAAIYGPRPAAGAKKRARRRPAG